MSDSKHELSPGTIAGIVVGTLLVLAVLSAAGIVLRHRRLGRRTRRAAPLMIEARTPLSKTPQRRTRRAPSRKASPRLSVEQVSLPMPLARTGRSCEKGDVDGDTSVATLNVVISPSLPRVFKLGTEDGEGAAVEVRVTPPTPVASRSDLGMPSPTKGRASRRTRPREAGGGGLGIQSDVESRWWVM